VSEGAIRKGHDETEVNALASSERARGLDTRLAGMALSVLPVWVYDPKSHRIVWANDPAVLLWNATDRDELYARDLSGVSEAARVRIARHIDEARAGRSVRESWTLYPRGVPVTVTLITGGVTLDDGTLGVLLQAIPNDLGPDPGLVRGIEALRHSSVLVALLDDDGEVLMRNPAALNAFGSDTPFASWFSDAEAAASVLRAVHYGQLARRELIGITVEGERWYALEARPTVDPVTGRRAVLVQMTDETARRGAEENAETQARLVEELHRTLDVVEQQKEQILALSAPILEVGEGAHRVLAVPVIGALDEARRAEIGERLLAAVVARRARRVILDLTGADGADAASAAHLVSLARAIRLLGAEAVVTGMPRDMARAMSEARVDLSGVRVFASLSQALSGRTRRP